MQLFKTFTVEVALIGIACSLLAGNVRQASAESDDSNSLNDSMDPVVITGNLLPSLYRAAIDRIVGFRYQNGWQQIPIQIDERKYVDFRQVYNDVACWSGTMAYADPNTYVGPDTYLGLDIDDELVFMAKDVGNLAPLPGDSPVGVLEESCVEIKVQDPLDGAVGYVYLFKSDGPLAQDAGKDYVTYNFRLLRGPYIPHYNIKEGYNPEDSEIYTNAYRTHFSDRWIRDELQIFAGSATGVDILDRHRTGRAPGDCSRTENTASAGGGAFLTNKDGCIRAIRSYMRFNSAPYLQREHFFYEGQQKICTYFRAHDTVTDIRDLYDYSPDANGMFYFNDLNLNGVRVDGIPDYVNHGHINWEMVTGVQGTVTICHFLDTDIPNFKTVSYYGDDSTPELAQCTGDQYQYGTSGLAFDPIPFTDPVLYPTFYNSLVFYRTDYYESPDQPVDAAIIRYQKATTPLEVVVTALNPVPALPIFFVDDNALNDPGQSNPTISDPFEDGSVDHPYDSIQEAINAAWPRETVIVLPGTYSGDGNHDIKFLGKEITVRSLDPNDSAIVAATVIECQGPQTIEHRGFVFDKGESAQSVLAGLTITNASASYGGGIMCSTNSSPTISKCVLRGNRATQRGGGLYNALGSPLVTSCIFSGNTAADGGALWNYSNPRVVNCTFTENSTTTGGGIHNLGGNLTLVNCILWNNTPTEVRIGGGTVSVTYSDIRGGFTGEGNIAADPLFADPANGDYHLKSRAGRWDPLSESWVIDGITSPCIDAGDPGSPVGDETQPNGGRINMGAYGGTTEASKSP